MAKETWRKDISGCASGTSTPFLGTKYYRAPETRHALPGQENYDAVKVDVFALGVTLRLETIQSSDIKTYIYYIYTV